MNINTNPSKPSQDSCEELQDVETNPEKEPPNPDDPAKNPEPENPDDPVKNRNDFDEEEPEEGKSEATTPKSSECPAWPPQDCEMAKGDKVRILMIKFFQNSKYFD